jgi:hypothetical protein
MRSIAAPLLNVNDYVTKRRAARIARGGPWLDQHAVFDCAALRRGSTRSSRALVAAIYHKRMRSRSITALSGAMMPVIVLIGTTIGHAMPLDPRAIILSRRTWRKGQQNGKFN